MDPEFSTAQQNLTSWIYAALGLQYTVLLVVAGLFSSIIALIVVVRGKGPMASAALLLVIPAPFLIGVFAALHGAMNSYSIIAMSSVSPKPSEWAQGIAISLIAPMVGMVLMTPGYAIAVIGALVRSISADSRPLDA